MGGIVVALVLLLGFVLLVAAGTAVVVLFKRLRAREEQLRIYAPVTDLEGHARRLAAENAQAAQYLAQLQQQQQALLAELGTLGEQAYLHEIGLTAPRYDFGSADEYRLQLEGLRNAQAAMAKAGRAAQCTTQWEVSGSRAKGRKTTDHILKLMLRAFNGECDALVAKVKSSNVAAYEARIQKSCEQINRLGSSFDCYITAEYLNLKLQELWLVQAYQARLEEEKEEQRHIKEQMREEQRAQKEFERAVRESERETERYQQALEKARAEVAQVQGAKQQKLLDRIAEMEAKLQQAEEQRQRSLSMAQQTRVGHVYVISNVGSFGENVFKVGMTRRLEPLDRVHELGDASVPFKFDVHAMIHSQDAPSLEKTLHDVLHERRVNKVNQRKEFFRATLAEIEQIVRQHHGEFRLTRHAEAIEYRQTLAIEAGRVPAQVGGGQVQTVAAG